MFSKFLFLCRKESHGYFFLISYKHHMDISSLHAQIVSVFLGILFVSKGSHLHHMDIYFLREKVVYVLLGLLFVTKGSYMHHIDIYFLHAQIVYVFLGLVFVTARSYMHYMDISSCTEWAIIAPPCRID